MKKTHLSNNDFYSAWNWPKSENKSKKCIQFFIHKRILDLFYFISPSFFYFFTLNIFYRFKFVFFLQIIM